MKNIKNVKYNVKSTAGITLVALSITIIVLIILTTTFTYNISSYVDNKKKSQITADLQRISERVERYYAENKELPALNKYGNLEILSSIKSKNDNENYYIVDLDKIGGLKDLTLSYGMQGYKQALNIELDEEITDITDIFIVNEQSHIIYYPKGVKCFDKIIYKIEEDVSKVSGAIRGILRDGSWNDEKKVNSPKIEGTGLTAIYWDDTGKEIELTENSLAEEWQNWYNYDNGKWANAITKDSNGNITGYFVWIPRYAYKIKSNLGTSTTGEIEVVFVDINNKNGDKTYLETYPTVENNSMTDFVVHPAFTTNIVNGGWDENIPGFWVAKYPAGYQANTITSNEDGSLYTTISNSSDTVVYSNKTYTTTYSSYKENVYGNIIVGETKISYPVFKPLTYAYNNISTGDSYIISRDIQNATSFYGLNNVDSHMLKNSEWGACTYLTQSRYGRNGIEVNINNYYTSTSSPYRTALTGVYANDTDTTETDAISIVNAYNTTIGKKGSSTGNLYGVYDLSGCVWERTTGYIVNSLGEENRKTYGNSYTTGVSNKYATVYPHNSGNDTSANNYIEYKNLVTNRYGFGDAILEVSTSGSNSTSWNNDYSNYFQVTSPFLLVGGNYNSNLYSGIYAFNYTKWRTC